ncbi:MAG: twin-arginine translocase subunit TatB [Gammaproteobacteria bacterium]|nr:twin-arginine translocase subunit TatB [Gammaproteobacteria bacterium]MBI5617176.1 twin-arginine translocase subunit TatB [Gammaproteobacteria bacterium]
MFGAGFWEFALVGVVALVVVGPERLPGLVRTAGLWIGRAQRMARELKSEFEQDVGLHEIRQVQNQIEQSAELPRPVGETLREQESASAPGNVTDKQP